MTRATTIVTDGTPDSEALVQWLERRAGGLHVVRALSPKDVRGVVERYRRAEPGVRLVVLADAHDDTDVTTHDALVSVHEWLAALGPYDRRALGVETIDDAVVRGASGAPPVERLARALSAVPTKPTRRSGKAKRGRPPGSDPFRGAGFDVCVRMLLSRGAAFTERALAEACERSPFAVHRVLVQLEEKGLIERTRGASKVRHDEALRDELATAWVARLGRPRKGWAFNAPARRGVETAIDALRAAGLRPLLAGPSAPDAHLVGGITFAYCDRDPVSVLEGAGFSHTGGVGRIVVWPAVERAAHFDPKYAETPQASTNVVVTYLDLVYAGTDRDLEAARQMWALLP